MHSLHSELPVHFSVDAVCGESYFDGMSTTLLPQPTEMYEALVKRDASYEGVFFVCVKTTGVFCRPTCHARNPKRKNVEFVRSIQEAILRGYRACKLCHPLDDAGGHPAWIESLIERVKNADGQRVTDADLRADDVDPVRVRRYFQKHFQMTFHAWQRSWRLGEAVSHLQSGAPVDAAGFDSGFESSSGFRDAFTRLFGATPGRVDDVNCLYVKWLETPLGPMLAAASDAGLCMLEFLDRRAIERQIEVLRRRFDAVLVPGGNQHLEQIAEELREYFAGNRKEFDTELDLRGSPFQLEVWRRLLTIPYGETTSYSAIAAELDNAQASRAVGRANGDNRLAVIVPCHRVVRADGELSGYGGGLWRKRWLLDHEQRGA